MYFNDIIVFSKNSEMHMVQLRQVPTLLRDAGMTLRLNKCSFFAENINELEHIIRAGRLELSQATTAAVRELKDQTTQTDSRFFLGLSNVLRSLSLNF